MASTYSPDLRIELITTGEQAGVWGVTTNNNLSNVIEPAIAGYVSVAITSANQALTYRDGGTATGALNQSVHAMIAFTSALSTTLNVYIPPVPKTYTLYNTTSQSIFVYNSTSIGNTMAAGLGAVIRPGNSVSVWSDGTHVRSQIYNNWDLGLESPVAAQRYIQVANTENDPSALVTIGARTDVQNAILQARSGTAVAISGLALAGKAFLYSTGLGPSTGNSGSTGLYVWDNSYTPQIDFIVGPPSSASVSATINSSGNWSFNSKTISGATWNGAIIGNAYGGTGVNNSYTLTISGANRTLDQSVAIGASPSFANLVTTGYVSISGGNALNIYNTGNSAYVELTYNGTALLSNSPVSVTGTVTGTSITSTNNATINGLTAGQGNLAGASATAFGFEALSASVSGTYNTDNVAMGYQAGKAITTSGRNVSIGALTLQGNSGALVGSSVNFFGGNVAVGYSALYGANSDSSLNTAVGYLAGAGIRVNNYNTYVGGASAAPSIQTSAAAQNTALGLNAGAGITSGFGNIMIGVAANVTTGNYNVLLGWRAGSLITSGSSNIIVGGYDGQSGTVNPINRINSNYIVLSDGSGNISWYSTPTGANIQPRQPAVSVVTNSAQNNIMGATATYYTLQLTTERFDQSNSFDTTTYTFTAPVSGLYRFDGYALVYNADNTGGTSVELRLLTTPRSYNLCYYNSYPAASLPDTFSVAGSAFVSLAAGNTAVLQIRAAGGTTDNAGVSNATLNCYLVA